VKITFVGSGDAFCAGGQANQAFWVEAPTYRLLIDCGPTTLYRLQQMGKSPDELDAMLFTHFHGDHFSGVVMLDLDLTLVRKRVRDMWYYGGQGIRRRFQSLYRACYPAFYPNDQFARKFRVFSPHRACTLADDLQVTAIPMSHAPESLGYRVQIGDKRLAVTGDTSWCEEIVMLARESDVLICECEYYARRADNHHHLSYEELSEHKTRLGKTQVILTHASDEVWQRRSALDFSLATDGSVVVL
jgi:ribonuclease BN (tRNA processing enzyme)